jgi:hypothetical protein
MALTAGAAVFGGADCPPPHPAHTPAATKTRAAIDGRIQFVAGSVPAQPALSERSESKGLAICCLTGQWIGHSVGGREYAGNPRIPPYFRRHLHGR